MSEALYNPTRAWYGPAIHQAIIGGDLAELKRTAKEVEYYLSQVGDVKTALEQLKLEIVKIEAREKRTMGGP